MLWKLGVPLAGLVLVLNIHTAFTVSICPPTVICSVPQRRICQTDLKGCPLCFCRPLYTGSWCPPLVRIRCKADQVRFISRNSRGCVEFVCKLINVHKETYKVTSGLAKGREDLCIIDRFDCEWC